jgi:hypothetical protein
MSPHSSGSSSSPSASVFFNLPEDNERAFLALADGSGKLVRFTHRQP